MFIESMKTEDGCTEVAKPAGPLVLTPLSAFRTLRAWVRTWGVASWWNGSAIGVARSALRTVA